MNHVFNSWEDGAKDNYLYRVFSFERLLQFIETKQLVLVQPSMWEDPFENFFLSAIFTDSEGSEFSLNKQNTVFGQCWSLTRESDAMWRIYSQDQRGVKVRTTAGKLFNCIRKASNGLGSVYLGKVNYLPMTELNKLCENHDFVSMSGKSDIGAASTLFYKRREFKHENEVRIVFSNKTNGRESSKLLRFDVEPLELIDQIVFDPRINDDLYKVYSAHLEKIGFNNIKKSALYEPPKLHIKLEQTT
ncbi:DUF2971 domain-containing protein [Vibrio parahaemolyticus]|nr:DUF2971 domain-containing protein [Vibrio parahaemolyticus]MBE4249031.1 DUF2971 domain-containing protein [Vibrio parahaemolyticus]MDF5636484.1 DUF2971 domain-containing protein [Vibrio parahaemolyticus]